MAYTAHSTIALNSAHMKRTLIALSLLILATGCTPPVNLYIGPPRPLSEVATVGLVTIDINVESYKIDNVDINQIASTRLLPGKHTVETVFRANYENADWSIELTTPNIGIVARAKCTATFTTKAGESLFINLNPGGNSLLGGHADPRLSIRKEGFNMPDLFKGQCEVLPNGVTLNW